MSIKYPIFLSLKSHFHVFVDFSRMNGYHTTEKNEKERHMERIVVELCMGSSCFARGNAQALTLLENYIAEKHLEQKVELIGHLCLGSCSSGPNIKIGEQSYNGVAPECVVDLLSEALEVEENR